MLRHKSGEYFSVSFQPLSPTDVTEHMSHQDGWDEQFDWMIYFQDSYVELYKLLIAGDDRIQGVIALKPKDLYVEVCLIESAPHNRGSDREFLNICMLLFAFASRRSLNFGYHGFVSFVSKQELIPHYQEIFRANLVSSKGHMVIDGTALVIEMDEQGKRTLDEIADQNGGYVVSQLPEAIEDDQLIYDWIKKRIQLLVMMMCQLFS